MTRGVWSRGCFFPSHNSICWLSHLTFYACNLLAWHSLYDCLLWCENWLSGSAALLVSSKGPNAKRSWSSGCSWHYKVLELEQHTAGGECASLNPGKCSCLWFVISWLVLSCPMTSCVELHALIINNEYINRGKCFCGWSTGPVS